MLATGLNNETRNRMSGRWNSEYRPTLHYSTLNAFCYIIIALFIPESLSAAVFNIPSGDVSALIRAINAANSNKKENDIINLKSGTYVLTQVNNFVEGANGLPSISSTIIINGKGADATFIKRDANAPPFRILYITPEGSLSLNSINISGGFLECCSIGGGILNDGQLTIANSTISSNSAEFEGGGIAGNDQVTVLHSTISDNSAQDGGGLFGAGPFIIKGSAITGNSVSGFGGGMEAIVEMSDSRVTDNFAGFIGTAIIGVFTIENSVISNNSTDFGGVVTAAGDSTIINSTISSNTSDFLGAIISESEVSLEIVNSSITGNSGSPVINNFLSFVSIVNSTIANNDGAVVGNFDGVTVFTNSTISNNEFGIYNDDIEFSGTVELTNTIITDDCYGPITSLGNNISPTCDIEETSTDLFIDPELGDFIDNNTPGNGHFPLLPTSRAIDAGNNNVCLENPLLSKDQIGNPRVDICDIGAIEFQTPFKDKAQCISKLIKQNCSGLKGKGRADCNHQQQQFCKNLFEH